MLTLKKIKNLALISLIAVFALGCTKGGNLKSTDGAIYLVSGNSNAQQLVPQGGSTGTGTFSGWYDEGLNVLTFTVTWNALWTGSDAVTSVNFYGPATAGANGNQLRSVAFSSTAATGTINLGLGGYSGFSAAEKADLFSGKWYYVICTTNFPNGIVRGQLTANKR